MRISEYANVRISEYANLLLTSHTCKQEGEVVNTGKGHTRVFPFLYDSLHEGKRAHDEFIKHGDEAFKTSVPVYGVKGPSWWAAVTPDIINGTAIDYMHTVLLGIVRRLLKLWFDSKFSSEPFSAANLVDTADRRLSFIKPPHYITRHPRSIKQHSQYWKASRCRSWLFHYSVPVLDDILKKIFYDHYLLFVDAIFILSQESISPEELLHCEELLMKFCCLFSTLYGLNNMSANLHQLLHLHDVVKSLGPLWIYSCFSFESMNGKLLNFFHGTQSVPLQIATTATTLMKLPSLGQNLRAGSSISEIYRRLSSPNDRFKITEEIYDGLFIIGAKHLQILPEQYFDAVSKALNSVPTRCFGFYKLLVKGEIFTSSHYKTVSRNSYTVLYRTDDDSATLLGQVMQYVQCFPSCSCDTSCCKCARCFAIVRKISIVTNMTPQAVNSTYTISPKLMNIISGVLTHDYEAIPVANIKELCTYADMRRGDKRVYASVRPNRKETD